MKSVCLFLCVLLVGSIFIAHVSACVGGRDGENCGNEGSKNNSENGGNGQICGNGCNGQNCGNGGNAKNCGNGVNGQNCGNGGNGRNCGNGGNGQNCGNGGNGQNCGNEGNGKNCGNKGNGGNCGNGGNGGNCGNGGNGGNCGNGGNGQNCGNGGNGGNCGNGGNGQNCGNGFNGGNCGNGNSDGNGCKPCDTVARDAEFPSKYKKYTVVNTPMMWHDAVTHCRSLCQTLASVTSQMDQDYLEATLENNAMDPWIGAHCSSKFHCTWQNSQAFINSVYEKWGLGEPQVEPHGFYGLKFNCIRINSADNTWQTAKCSQKRPFVCQSFEE